MNRNRTVLSRLSSRQFRNRMEMLCKMLNHCLASGQMLKASRGG